MSAETLRRAAAAMREEHGRPEHQRHEMWTAMADWLEHQARYAARTSSSYNSGASHGRHALAVAVAYLGASRKTRMLPERCLVCVPRSCRECWKPSAPAPTATAEVES